MLGEIPSIDTRFKILKRNFMKMAVERNEDAILSILKTPVKPLCQRFRKNFLPSTPLVHATYLSPNLKDILKNHCQKITISSADFSQQSNFELQSSSYPPIQSIRSLIPLTPSFLCSMASRSKMSLFMMPTRHTGTLAFAQAVSVKMKEN